MRACLVTFFRLTLWSQEAGHIVRKQSFSGSRIEAERALSEFWNNSPAVFAETGRYRARLHELGYRRALFTIG